MPVISTLYTAGGVLQSSTAGVYTLADLGITTALTASGVMVNSAGAMIIAASDMIASNASSSLVTRILYNNN